MESFLHFDARLCDYSGQFLPQFFILFAHHRSGRVFQRSFGIRSWQCWHCSRSSTSNNVYNSADRRSTSRSFEKEILEHYSSEKDHELWRFVKLFFCLSILPFLSVFQLIYNLRIRPRSAFPSRRGLHPQSHYCDSILDHRCRL